MILLGAVAGLWAIEVVDLLVLRGALDGYGIRPRTLPGLGGILVAPLLHGGFGHLAANSTALLVLGWFVMLRGTALIVPVTVIGALVGGLGIWLVGSSSSVHLGSSIVVFAYLGFLLLRGFFERKVLAMAGSVAVAILYGGMLFGVLPGRSGVSWEGHLFGFLGGVLAARILVTRMPSASSAGGASARPSGVPPRR
jgi:membrane associated rhomboid family serine protease